MRKSTLHSMVTSKGQTTIPGKIRKALGMKPGDRLVYVMQGNHVIIPGASGDTLTEGCTGEQKGQRHAIRPNPEGTGRSRLQIARYSVSKRRLVNPNARSNVTIKLQFYNSVGREKLVV